MRLEDLKGVGPKLAERLRKMGIQSVEDILFHFPCRYQDRTRILAIRDLRPGDAAVIEGEVLSSKITFGRKRQLEIILTDSSGVLVLKFFYFTQAQQQAFKPRVRFRCYGEIKKFRHQLMMIHPEYQRVDREFSHVEEDLTPIYPSVEGLQQGQWRKISSQALEMLRQGIILADILPPGIREKYGLAELTEALSLIHRPPPEVDQSLLMSGLHPMQKTLAFEELLAHQVSVHQLKIETQKNRAYSCEITEQVKCYQQQFLGELSFSLTRAQQQAWQDVAEDLRLARPMLRLIQGDVGSGKTVIAALSALQVIGCGYQVAIMAPTEMLAEQHYESFKAAFSSLKIQIAWLGGNLKVAVRRDVLAKIASGEAQLIVGTHALFQKIVKFHNLALIVIDEQHRFGVEQRQALYDKGCHDDHYPHQIIMTATPIPRTLAMTLYADLDISIIDEMPQGRIPIKTAIVNNQRRSEVIERIRMLSDYGRQVYWVCPFIEESQELQCEAAEKTVQLLKKNLEGLSVGLVHGRMKSCAKQDIMDKFRMGKVNVLVATTVIEVGINVPNATLIVIENPERMGLAQLHQLRGRVGRGEKESHCVLLCQEPLSEYAFQRLSVMRESNDGFYIAEQDLALRGPGELLGTRQTGIKHFRIADVFRDKELLPSVQKVAKVLISEYPGIIDALLWRWIGHKCGFSKI